MQIASISPHLYLYFYLKYGIVTQSFFLQFSSPYEKLPVIYLPPDVRGKYITRVFIFFMRPEQDATPTHAHLKGTKTMVHESDTVCNGDVNL